MIDSAAEDQMSLEVFHCSPLCYGVQGLSIASSDVDKYNLSAAIVCVVPELAPCMAHACVCVCAHVHMQSSLTICCDVLWCHSGTLLRLKMSFPEIFILFVLAIFCIREKEEE